MIGGDVLKAFEADPESYRNACALRVSMALNGADADIPYIKGQTLKGADGKNYIYNPFGRLFHSRSNKYFGNIAPYTGFQKRRKMERKISQKSLDEIALLKEWVLTISSLYRLVIF